MRSQHILIIISLILCSCHTDIVKEGEHGVIFKKFSNGLDTTKVYSPGEYTLSNWNHLIIYNTENQEVTSEITIFSENTFEIHITYDYKLKPIPERLGLLHYYIGHGYDESISDLIRKELYDKFKDLTKNEISEILKDKIESSVLTNVKQNMGHNYVELSELRLIEIKFK